MNEQTSKPILSLDFDGVISLYTSGWQGATVIPDPPVDGAMEFLRQAVQRFDVAVFSTRSHEEGGIEAMRDYIEHHLTQYLNDLTQAGPNASAQQAKAIVANISFPTTKPKAHVGLDDRILNFRGEFPSLDELEAFKPWNR